MSQARREMSRPPVLVLASHAGDWRAEAASRRCYTSVMAKVKKVKLPDGFCDIGHVTQPEFMPNQSTMDTFDAEPYTLWRACSEAPD
jgi:hypothetical protein